MKNKIWVSTFREIKNTLGRYIAIVAIIALGVGFFSGLMVTDSAMRSSMYEYLSQHQFYDYRLISTLGFEADDINALNQEISINNESLGNVRYIEAGKSSDMIVTFEDKYIVHKIISIPENINLLELTAGRMPENDNECLLDSARYTEEKIGDTFTLSEGNDQDDLDKFKNKEYTVVGLAQSPLYIQYERGSTSLGDGTITAFMYVTESAFNTDYYTEVYVKLDSDYDLYSDEYISLIDSTKPSWEKILKQLALDRYSRIVSDAQDELDEAKQELEDGIKELEEAKLKIKDGKKELEEHKKELENGEAQIEESKSELAKLEAFVGSSNPMYLNAKAELDEAQAGLDEARQQIADAEKEILDGEEEIAQSQLDIDDAQKEIDDAQKEIDDIEEPDTFVLGRTSNVGYVCFESDSTIVGAIAKVFPVFFFMVAALVCMTTMNRMVEDERTQIGVLKALGYSTASIMVKFIFYSGSAAVLGALIGFISGTICFPKAIWFAYNMMYNTSDISYYFSLPMLLQSFIVALLCSVGVTFATCRVELYDMAASLMRPKAPKAGKRIFLEYLPVFWNKLKFLQKVSLRNIFRFKGRLIMMLLGIGGCTALMITGFGIYDSIADIAQSQYSKISLYDIDITLNNPYDNEVDVLSDLGYTLEDYVLYYQTSVDMVSKAGTKNLSLDVYDENTDLNNFINYHSSDGQPLSLPGLNEALISHGVAKQYNVNVGDTITLSSDDINMQVKISGIFENFIYNYVVITTPTYDTNVGKLDNKKSVILNIDENDDAYKISALISSSDDVAAVTATNDMLERVSNMMKSLNIIVYIVLACAAALAGVVVYNLTNINIAERVREIATIKVLGFYKNETSSYVFRENLLLSLMGGIIGLFLGKLLHAYVISKIVVDMITFDVRITKLSYCLSLILTVLFTVVINLLMSKKLENISMTESLKAVE